MPMTLSMREGPTPLPVAACPGYMRSAPGISTIDDMEGRICYLLNPNVNQGVSPKVRPFGYPNPLTAPLRRVEIGRYGSLAALFAVSDVDKGNVTDPSVGWWSDLPYKPVHGATRNQLFFDWHVAPVKAITDSLQQ